MEAPTQSRRSRLRAETAAEIKSIALAQMAADGPDAISLRAIAREMGMTAGAIYSYFDTRDTLISALITDLYNALADQLEAARDSRPPDDPVGRLLAVGRLYRHWAIANPQEFRLVYGDPVHGYHVPSGGVAAEAEHRACAVLVGLVAAGWSRAEPSQSSGEERWSDFDPRFASLVRVDFPDLPPAAIALGFRLWGRMHGLLALEVYGHLRPQIQEPGKLYEAELIDLTRTLGLAP